MRLVTLIAAALLLPALAPAAPVAQTRPARAVYTAPSVVTALAAAADKTVDLDVSDVSVKEALKRIFDQAGQEYVLDEDVPDDARVSIRARGVKLHTALDLVTQAAAVGWTTETRSGKRVYRVGRSVRPRTMFSGLGDLHTFTLDRNGARVQTDLPRLFTDTAAVPYRLFFNEERSSFTCPHCKGKVTVLGTLQQPPCPKCGRTFQREWQFCPFDGSKRPRAASDWRYCPLCGKQVEPEDTR